MWVRHACHRTVKGFKAISRTLEFHHHRLLHKQVANGKTKRLWPRGGCPAKLTRRAQLEWEQKICWIAKASLKVANINGNEPTVGKTSNKQSVSCRTPRKEAAAWEHHCMTKFGEKTTLKLQSGIGDFFMDWWSQHWAILEEQPAPSSGVKMVLHVLIVWWRKHELGLCHYIRVWRACK